MKRKNSRLSISSLVVFLLVGVMAVSSAISAFSGISTISPNGSTTNSAILAGGSPSDEAFANALDKSKVVDVSKKLKKDDKIGLIIEMDEATLLDTYLANPGDYASFSEYRMSIEGQKAAENLIKKQNALYNKIARQVNVKLKYNYVNTINGFAIEMTYGDRSVIDKIAYRSKVISTSIGEIFEAPDTEVVKNSVNAQLTGIFDSSDSIKDGIGGQGIAVAVLDTGLDWEHIAFDANYPLFKEDNTFKMNEKYVEDRLPLLNAYQTQALMSEVVGLPSSSGMEYADVSTPYLGVKDVYKSAKVPFAYDYADHDPEVSTHTDNAHGTHVAGIVAGHSDTPYRLKTDTDKTGKLYLEETDKNGKVTGKFYTWENGERVSANVTKDQLAIVKDTLNEDVTGITGVAPKAQLVIMKVFSDFDAGAPAESLLAALEDCITLGVDVINMSLGSDSGFEEDEGARNSIIQAYNAIGRSGISLVAAASNSFSSGSNSHYGLNLISNPDSGTIGSPASFNAGISVGSINGVPSKYLLAGNGTKQFGTAYFSEAAHTNGDSYDFIGEISAIVKEKYPNYIQSDGKTLRVPYVTIPGTGTSANYAGKDVKGKIALVARGTTTFEEKAKEAQRAGALACIIYNNVAGVIRMQIGDEINIPVCSISMDAAFTIKNQDVYGNAYFFINEDDKAGPFMNEFSSWGPTPSLGLKPEITAHGGEIYSAVPGDPTAYERMSGTSMAAPNLTGVVALLRQYMQKEESIKKFKLDKNGNNKVDTVEELNLMESTIYQILMSTTTIALDELGNPVSPRKQGSGLADLERSRKTEQYLVVKDKETGEVKERTKIELKDDKNRTGVYETEFYVKNVGNTDQEYKLNAFVMTEGISTDGKTVNEKAHLLEGYTATLKVNDKEQSVNDNIKVPKDDEVKVTYTITLGRADRDWLEQFPNGMYVEGYVCLQNTKNIGKKDEEKTAIDLNVPYLAFYGDWSDAPIFDYDIYEVSADENDEGIDEDDKRYSGSYPIQILGYGNMGTSEFAIALGAYPFNVPDGMQAPLAEADKAAISFNTNYGINNLFSVAGFLRNAKRVFYTVSDATTGQVLIDDVYSNARKSAASGNIGGAWFDIPIAELLSPATGEGVFNNGKYNLTVYMVLDGYENILTSKEAVIDFYQAKNRAKCTCSNPDSCAIQEKCLDGANCKCIDKKIRYTWSSDFWIDTDAPFISNTELRIEKDRHGNASYYLDLYLTDNHYLNAIGFNYWDKDSGAYVPEFEEGFRPLYSSRNTTTKLTYNLTTLWDKQISEALNYLIENKKGKSDEKTAEIEAHPEKGTYPTQFQVTLYDYAFNRSHFTIDLFELMQNVEDVAFGDIGNYSIYSNKNDKNDKISVYVSSNDTIATEDGKEKLIDSITMIPGQRLEIMRMLVTKPSNAWTEDLILTCDPENSIIRIDSETKEIYTIGHGKATITVKSLSNENVKATLQIYVLSDEEISTYNITAKSIQTKTTLTDLNFEQYNRSLNAGEHLDLEIKTNPWFVDLNLDLQKNFILWSSNNDSIATVYATADSTKATVIANSSRYDENGKYVKNLSASVDIKALLCEINEKGNKTVYLDEANHILKTELNAKGEIVKYYRVDENGTYVEVDKAKVKAIKYNETFYSAVFRSYVYPEFVTSGSVLQEYHGWPQGNGGKIVVPGKDLNITHIGSNLFYKRSDINSIEFSEGIEVIGTGACAYMSNLKEVIFPSTLLKISGYAFIAEYYSVNDTPNTVLSKVDLSKCRRPIQVDDRAFLAQRYIGVDFDNPGTDIQRSRGEDRNNENKVVLLERKEGEPNRILDLSHVRTIGDYAFYGMEFLDYLDVSSLRSCGRSAFYGLGSKLPKYFKDAQGNANKFTKLILGEKTAMGQAAFVYSTIGELTVPMKRVTQQSFIGLIDSADMGGDDEPLYYGDLKKITFTADNLVIEDQAFIYTSVKEIEFQGTVDYIGAASFALTQLEKITFLKECKVIGDQAFYEAQLKSVKLPKGLTKLGEAAFAFNENLTEVDVGDCALIGPGETGAPIMSGSAFLGCAKLENFKADENSEYDARDGVLYSKDGKKLICVPSNKDFQFDDTFKSQVEEIGDYAFVGNQKITKVDLSETNIKKIGVGAFYSCEGLKEATLPSTITEIPAYCFYTCPVLETVETSNAKITKIGEFAFFESTKLKEFMLPNALTELGTAAFAYVEGISVLSMPDGLEVIPEACFFACSNLSMIYFNNVKVIEDQAFTLTDLRTIGSNKIEKIGYASFASCNKLTNVNLPYVKEVGEAAFLPAAVGGSYVGTILDLSMPNVEIIGNAAFAFQDLMIGDAGDSYDTLSINNCTDIGESAFLMCKSLQLVSFNKIERIQADAFSNSGMIAALLPASLIYVAPSAFTQSSVYYYDLEESDNNDYFVDGGVLYRELPYGLELVAYPTRMYYNAHVNVEYTILDGTVRIAEYAFAGVEYLMRVNIPASVERIGDAAFLSSSVKVYNFLGGTAPELEASQETISNSNEDVYFWQVYRNFYLPFSFTTSAVYKYNPIRPGTENDVDIVYNHAILGTVIIQNHSFTGEGFSDYDFLYDMVLVRPSNATGFDTFVWANYFETVLLTEEVRDSRTKEVMDILEALPDPDKVTLDDKAAIVSARGRYESLPSTQKHFVEEAGLVERLTACEEALAAIDETETEARNRVIQLIENLPAPQSITLDDEEKVVEARTAYDALSNGSKAIIAEQHGALVTKLDECEAKLEELKEKKSGCGSCGTVTFGSMGGGTGLMIGLFAVALACLAIIFLRKRNTAK